MDEEDSAGNAGPLSERQLFTTRNRGDDDGEGGGGEWGGIRGTIVAMAPLDRGDGPLDRGVEYERGCDGQTPSRVLSAAQ